MVADKDIVERILTSAEKGEVTYAGSPERLERAKIRFEHPPGGMGSAHFTDFDMEHLDPWEYDWWDLDVDRIGKMELFYSTGKNRWTTNFRHWWLLDRERSTLYLIGSGW